MFVLYLILAGILIFVIGVAFLGVKIRRNPTKANAERSSRIAHFLFFAGLGFPILVSFFYPGITRLDGLTGLSPLPAHLFFLKYFEEKELELRFGESYQEYKQQVPFLFPRFTGD